MDSKITTLRELDGASGFLAKNAHPRDSRIRFEEKPHLYWLQGYPEPFISGTTITHHYFPKFDPDKTIMKMRISGSIDKPDSKYYGMTNEQIRDLWKNNSGNEAGTFMHSCIEFYLNKLPVENDSIEFNMFLNYAKDYNIENIIYRTEWMIYSTDHQIAGSIDAIVKNPDGTFTIVDWKRSKQIKFENSYQRFKRPFQHLEDCNFNHYAFQLNLYRTIIQKYYGMVVSGLYLVVCHPDNQNKNYQKIDLPIMDKEMEVLLDIRLQELKKNNKIYPKAEWETEEEVMNRLAFQSKVNPEDMDIEIDENNSHTDAPVTLKSISLDDMFITEPESQTHSVSNLKSLSLDSLFADDQEATTAPPVKKVKKKNLNKV